MLDYVRPLQEGLAPVQPSEAGTDRAAEEDRTLWIRLPSEDSPQYRRATLLLSMFPGNTRVVLYMADTKKRLGGKCLPDKDLLDELKDRLGADNVVLK